jgi:tetratricopeptide (TPR) repeat protein
MSMTQNKLADAFAAARSGNLAAAEKRYRAILRTQPDNPDLLYLLAMLCLDTERPGMAAKYFQRALKTARAQGRPIDPSWLLALGTAQQREDDHEGALETYGRALASDPNSVDVMFCRATALQSLQRTEDAIEAYKNLLDREPRHAAAAYNFGLVLRDAGKPENARVALQKAVLLKPDYAGAYAALAPVLEDLGWHEAAIGEIESILRKRVPERENEAALEFAWARRLDYLRRYEEAFDHYVRGNRVKRASLEERGIGYDREKEEKMDRRLVEVCAGDDVFGLYGNDSGLLLFVVGMPRSGTTLTEQILASHSQLAGAGELIAIGIAVKRLGEVQGYPGNPPTEPALQKIADRYLQRLRQVDGKALRVVDNLPGNFRHLRLIAVLEFYTSKQSFITASHSQVRQPVYRSSIGRWKRYGDGVAPLVRGLSEFLAEDAAATEPQASAASSSEWCG